MFQIYEYIYKINASSVLPVFILNWFLHAAHETELMQ